MARRVAVAVACVAAWAGVPQVAALSAVRNRQAQNLEASASADAAGATAANPIRKVVTLLQMMQKKIQEEAAKEKELYTNFMCYCKTSGGELKQSLSTAEAKAPQVESDIKEAEAQHVQLGEDLKRHQGDRDAARSAMQESTALREKEAAEFAKQKSELDANLAALGKAITAIEKGMTGGFLQTGSAQVLRRFFMAKPDMIDLDRQEVLAFLSGTSSAEYSPKSGEIAGILKEINDDMSKSLADITSTEETAIKDYEELMAAKKKEVDALTRSIESKTERIGSLAVEIVQMKNDLTDTQAQLMEDREFLADLEKNCGTKEQEWDEREKTRADELLAISETIQLLNDDDALDLFKRTLPSASASFVQVGVRATAQQQARALEIITQAKEKLPSGRPGLDFIALALAGKKFGLEKVHKMIDDLVATLDQEQRDDDNKREYCNKAIDSADDKKKGLEQSLSDLETTIANAEEGIATSKDEIKALTEAIKTLDKEVAEQTELRQSEHKEFSELMASNSAAKEVLQMAKNRLNKFYNPKLYKSTTTTSSPPALFQVSSVRRHKDAPPPPPETYGAYSSKSEESTGVIAMLDRLTADLDKEMAEAQREEELAQQAYAEMMAQSAKRRATDAQSLTQHESTKASLEQDLESSKEKKASTGKELMATMQYIKSLHGECDWLVQYYDVRKEARASERDSLMKAKAVLSGADFSLLQQHAAVPSA